MKIFFEDSHEENRLSSKGSYAIVLRVNRSTVLPVGRLGRFRFPPGYYVYVGSAQGPGGIGARLGRHLRAGKPLRWHIDYLREKAAVHGVWAATGPENREHGWAGILENADTASVPAAGFGASDCRCTAHLFHFPHPPEKSGLFDRLPGGPVRLRTAGRPGPFRGQN
ncbi:MAG: GIY-YIG nuclease family protein [Desulfobacterales bacterium]|jgi:Uri superfamily endonuclease